MTPPETSILQPDRAGVIRSGDLVSVPKNPVRFVNNHVEIRMGKKVAFVDVGDFETVKNSRWCAHPRGPISEIILSQKPRRRKYRLMVMAIFGKPMSFIDGNHYDLRRANVADKQFRIGSRTRQTKRGEDCGIHLLEGAWEARAKWRDKYLIRSFSIRKYGEPAAKRMAREARKMMVGLGYEEARERLKTLNRLPRLRVVNEIKNAPIPEPQSLIELAKLYALREHLPESMVPHLHRMLLLGGGRMPKLEHRKNLAAVNIYGGNQEYENSVVDIPLDENGRWEGYQLER